MGDLLGGSQGLNKTGLEESKSMARNRYNQMNALADEDLASYKRYRDDPSALTPAQRQALEVSAASEKARASQFLSQAGLSDSTLGTSVKNQIDTNVAIAEGQMNLEDMQLFFSNAMQEIGVADQAAANLSNLYTQQREESNAHYAAIASGIAGLMGGGAGMFSNATAQQPQSVQGGQQRETYNPNSSNVNSIDTNVAPQGTGFNYSSIGSNTGFGESMFGGEE